MLTKDLQTFLNVYVKPEPALKVDGIHGSLTTNAMNKAITKLREEYAKRAWFWRADFTITAIRTNNTYTDRFTDWIIVFYNNRIDAIPASTKPGVSSVMKNVQLWYKGLNGVAVLKEGQYIKTWSIQSAWWSGARFLYQVAAVTIYRDNNGDLLVNENVTQTDAGFGINWHSWAGWIYDYVGNLSEGCIVTKRKYIDHLIDLCIAYNPDGLVTAALLEYDNV